MFSQNSKLLLNPSTFKYQKGFTLIELLVVIAIIGILASVVLASLNTARTKGTIASIKSNLKNMIPQAELAYDVPGNYSTVCTDTKIVSMLTAITNAGGTASCVNTIDNTRWGVSARLNSDPTQNFAVDSAGVVTFDTADKPASNWDTANTNCAAIGGRLPSIEELKALWQSYGSVSIPANTGFVAGNYWSGNIYPPDSTVAYGLNMINGGVAVGGNLKTFSLYVRCVR